MARKWTDEEKEKQRQVALAQVEKGTFGGAGRGQGRKRKIRHSEVVADLARKDGKAIYDRLVQIRDNGTDANSLAAMRDLRSYEEVERQIELQEERLEIEDMKHDQLLALVVGQLIKLEDRGIIPGVIDGEVEEAEFRGITPDGENSDSAGREITG